MSEESKRGEKPGTESRLTLASLRWPLVSSPSLGVSSGRSRIYEGLASIATTSTRRPLRGRVSRITDVNHENHVSISVPQSRLPGGDDTRNRCWPTLCQHWPGMAISPKLERLGIVRSFQRLCSEKTKYKDIKALSPKGNYSEEGGFMKVGRGEYERSR